MPLIACQSTKCHLKLVRRKLNYRKEINLKERNKLCGGTFEKVFPNKRCFVTGGVILGFMKQTPLNAHGGGGGGCSFTEQFLMSVPFF